MVGNFFYHPDRSMDLAGSIQQLTYLKSLDISKILYFGEHLLDLLASTTSITDLDCTRGQFCAIMSKCQRLGKSAMFQSLSFADAPAGITMVQPDIFKSALQINGLTKVQLNILSFDMDDFIEGLNWVNCAVNSLEINSYLNDTEVFKLSTALEKNATIKRLSKSTETYQLHAVSVQHAPRQSLDTAIDCNGE